MGLAGEGAALLHDQAIKVTAVLEHLRDQAGHWKDFRDSVIDNLDVTVNGGHPRAFFNTGAGVANAQQVWFANKRRRGFLIQNVGANIAFLKMGDNMPLDVNDYSFQLPVLTAGALSLVSSPTMVPIYTGALWLFFVAGAAGATGIQVTDFT